MTEVKALAAMAVNGKLEPYKVTRRAVSANDVDIEIKYCGICHSDISQVKNEWGNAGADHSFPMVPGHEIAGVVRAVGENVTKFKVGQKVGVGCMVGSCRSCKKCDIGEEQYCGSFPVMTYNDVYRDPSIPEKGTPTYGGYSQAITVDEKFVVSIPENLELSEAAPLLCAGITVFSPLYYYGVRPNHKVGIAGLGGLGSMAVKFAKAMGAEVYVFSRTEAKRETATKDLGAHHFINTKDEEQYKSVVGKLDFVIDTVGVEHDVNLYIATLSHDGTLVLVGVPPKLDINPQLLIFGRRKVAGSLIGGIEETQAMLDFCGRNSITCDVEVVKGSQVNEAYERALKSDVKFRFSIDCSTLE